MLILTETEKAHALKLKNLIEIHGFSNVAREESNAGIFTGRELTRVLSWLKESGWPKADQLIEADQAILNEKEEPMRSKREKNKIDAALNKRLRNVFTRSDFVRLNIKEMSYAEAEKLCIEKEQERLKYGIKF